MVTIQGKTYKTVFDSAEYHFLCIKQWDEELAYIEKVIKPSESVLDNKTSTKLFEALKRKIAAEKKPHEEAIKELLNIIKAHKEDRSDNLEKTILYLRWIKGVRLEDIAEKYKYSFDHINRLHSEIIKAYLIKDE